MPAAHAYYSKHSRKISASQMSLPEQLQNATKEHASRSMTFLPATKYSVAQNEPTDVGDSALSSFYREYHDQYGQLAAAPLRQGALQTNNSDQTALRLNGASAVPTESRLTSSRGGSSLDGQEAVRPHRSSPGLKGRKSSVKNLVEQINATSTEDQTLLPGSVRSRNSSRNVSPILHSESHFQQFNLPRQIFGFSDANKSSGINSHDSLKNGDSTHAFAGKSTEMIAQSRRPLFGEVISGVSKMPIAGYGIQNRRERSGSEGSPLQSPMLAQNYLPESSSSNSYNAVTTSNAEFILGATVYSDLDNKSRRHRVNDKEPNIRHDDASETEYGDAQNDSHQNRNYADASHTSISARRGSASSEIEIRPRASTMNSTTISLDKSQNMSSRRPLSPPQIQSPGQRGKRNVVSGPKSPSLRANIIVPPPKISPPLRSSRPRLPVSTASTAASRAKMAEKFSAQQKINEEKRQASRRVARPPELSDVDLKERRLRITQALSRSLEGQELKGAHYQGRPNDVGSSRTVSATSSYHSQNVDLDDAPSGLPVVVINEAGRVEMGSEETTPVEGFQRREQSFSQNALDALQGASTAFAQDDDDSAALMSVRLHNLDKPTRLHTNLRPTHQSNEPSSALTESTMIDPEPQDDYQQAMLSQSAPDLTSNTLNQNDVRESTYDVFSDAGDDESVRIVLRNTTYLDDEEAIRKGYRPVLQLSEPTHLHADATHHQRSSWTSSIDDSDQEEVSGFISATNDQVKSPPGNTFMPPSSHGSFIDRRHDISNRSTTASDAYTIVNIVLQQHSTSGIVDQQFVDDVYQRILIDSPYGNENNLSADRIEQICLQEIKDREDTWYRSPTEETRPTDQPPPRVDDVETPTKKASQQDSQQSDHNNWLLPQTADSKLMPPPFPKGHRYKSSLDSVEDWADTSPSIGDWMRFAANDETRRPVGQKSATSSNWSEAKIESDNMLEHGISNHQAEDPELYSAPLTRPPHTPPPLPIGSAPHVEGSPFGSALIQRPQIPHRVASVSQLGRRSPPARDSPGTSMTTLGKVSTDDPVTPEQRRLKQRRNVVKELVDTEFTYEKDLRVLCDIYKQTASAALGEDDIKVLFGNVDQVQVFSKDFLMLLKSFAKPTYAMERPDRKKDNTLDGKDISLRPISSSSTLASARASENEVLTTDKDRESRIGQAFETSLADMERVYTEYIKNRHAANLRLEAVQKSASVCEWLKECKENSSDITNAWNLDALLVKPVQRITKYPLLLKELVDATPEGHPDLPFVRRALQEVIEINVRINDVKKHAELVDQVLNRKRKDSDVRAGLSKAFGRRAEKLKQHVGMTELYEDAKYNEIKIHYDNNIVQLMVVGNDCSSYGRSVTKWVNKMVEIAAAAEAWVDVGHSNHQEAESRLRQFAMVVRGISTIALPDHLEQLGNKVLSPMQQAVDAMTKFKTDPKGLLQKREKRMIDYAQLKGKKERGEKLDRKMAERMEQSEALNVEAKERMRKLITATARLVQTCQVNLVQMQVTWQGMVRQKLSAAMGIPLDHLDVDDIEKEWQLDFDFQEASALSLGICNGSLLAEAANMVTFQPSGTTLNGDESPRQASFTSASKRSTSLASENSYPPIPDYDPRTSGTYGHQYHEHQIPFAKPRGRAQSTASARYIRTPDLSQQGFVTEAPSNYVRMETSSTTAPRLSVETHSPLMGSLGSLQPLQPDSSSRRPASSSTFFSASGTPPAHHQSTGASIFSSAMPMSDSPVVERFAEPAVPFDPDVLFTAASVYEFNIDRSRREAGFPYLTYVTGEIFDIIGERGELWLARNQDDPQKQIGWIWNKHFAKLAV